MTKAVNTMYLALFFWVLFALLSCRTVTRTEDVQQYRQEQVDSVADVREEQQVTLEEIRQQLEQVERQTEAFYEHVSYSPPDSSGKQYIIDRTTATNKQQELRNTMQLNKLQIEAETLQQKVSRLRADLTTYEQTTLSEQWKYPSYLLKVLVGLTLLQFIYLIIYFWYIRQKRP